MSPYEFPVIADGEFIGGFLKLGRSCIQDGELDSDRVDTEILTVSSIY